MGRAISDFDSHPVRVELVALQSRVFHGLRFERLWFDEDTTEIQIIAGNGEISGVVRTLLGTSLVNQLLSDFSGFPRSLSEVRTVTFGTMDAAYAGGCIEFQLSMTPTEGIARIKMAQDPESGREKLVACEFDLRFEISLWDRFCQDLDRFTQHKTEFADLFESGLEP